MKSFVAKTPLLKRVGSTALLGLFTGLLGFSQVASAHNDGAYSHDYRAVASNSSWMAGVDGNKRVSELSLPGLTTLCPSVRVMRGRIKP